VNAPSTNGAVVTFATAASGGCTSPNVISIPASGSTFPIGITTVTNAATDDCGTSTNCTFTITVIAPPPGPVNVASPVMSAGNQFMFPVQGAPGQNFVIEASTDLLNWTPLFTNTLIGTSTNWADPDSLTNDFRFYRILTVP
jgi:hypothetical protein